MEKVTKRQLEIFEWIKKNNSPSLKDIAEHFKIKESSVFHLLKKLQEFGFIERTRKARSIKILKENLDEISDKPLYHWVLSEDKKKVLLCRKQNLLDEHICIVPKDFIKTLSEDFSIFINNEIKNFIEG
jgi:SOS-response transcriptional repressor LexA